MTVDLEDLRTVGRATVYKKDRVAATLVRQPHGIEFRYHEDYLASGGEPVASTLPLTPDPVLTAAGALPPYFSNLLPEGRRLAALRAAVKTSADDELSLLLAVGADPVGDVRVVPDGVALADVEPRVRTRRWEELSFTELFAAETGNTPDRVGIPGVQPKASARMISFPVRKGPDRFILKLDPPEFRHLARNEWLMLQAARDSGLSTATAQLVRDRDGLEALAVQRFDRTPDGGLLAVEDACQATGRYPADKYQLSTEEACVGLTTTTDAPVVAGRTLLRWVTFGYLAGNGDLHAKNLAVAERVDGTVLPAPVYDVPSTYPYGDVTMALRVNGKIRDDIGREDLMALAARVGVPARAAGKVLDDVARRTDLWLGSLTESGFDRRTVHKWTRLVLHRRDRVAAGAARTAE